MINLPKDFKDILHCLSENSVEFVLVGGYAVAYHGYPRFTGDIDLLIRIGSQNASKVLQALQQFGMASLELTEEDFLKPNQVIQIGVHPLRIDLITEITGVDSTQVFKNAEITDIEGLKISVISKEDLIQNKRATGRTKDLADIEEIKKS